MKVEYKKDKSYIDYMNEISKEDLFRILLKDGMFSDKLPPIFQSDKFYQKYPLKKDVESGFYKYFNKSNRSDRIINFETMRNIGIPRTMHIPNPFGYYNQCITIINYWDEIINHFKDKTSKDCFKVSQMHINNSIDYNEVHNLYDYVLESDETLLRGDKKDSFIHKLKFNKSYYVKTDIAKFFDSIYTHSIPWALVGKEKAKKNHNKNEKYYNKLDIYTRDLKGNETTGIPIGPLSSNIIAEIILTFVDFNLRSKGWEFIRYIDDYFCFVETIDSGKDFLIDFNNELRYFNLHINHAKTNIYDINHIENGWINDLYMFPPIFNHLSIKEVDCEAKLTFRDIKRYLTLIKSLSNKYNDYAVIKYAMKVIYDCNLTDNAKELYIYEILNLSQLNTYLIPMLDYYIFDKYESFFAEELSLSGENLKKEFLNNVYDRNIYLRNNEAISFIIYYALKYEIEIENLSFNDIKNTESCVNYIMGYLYSKKMKEKDSLIPYKELAKELSGVYVSKESKIDYTLPSFQENWLFIYEVLSRKHLKDEWCNMKNKGVSFISYTDIDNNRIPF